MGEANLSKRTDVVSVEVNEGLVVHVRLANRILEDDEVVSETYHRYALTRWSDLSGQPDLVARVAAAAWGLTRQTTHVSVDESAIEAAFVKSIEDRALKNGFKAKRK